MKPNKYLRMLRCVARRENDYIYLRIFSFFCILLLATALNKYFFLNLIISNETENIYIATLAIGNPWLNA